LLSFHDLKYIRLMIKVYSWRGTNQKSDEFLKLCIGKFLDKGPDDIEVGKHDSGQPYLPSEPKLSVSLTHSVDLWACACSLTHDVGIDVQVRRPFNPKIFDRMCSEKELAELPDRGEDTFYKLWTIKEAALKCIGTGLQYPMNLLETDLTKNKIEVLENRPVIHLVHGQGSSLAFKKLSLFSDAEAHLVWSPFKADLRIVCEDLDNI
jgi:phosphopantetheine--protein transferase-like protein